MVAGIFGLLAPIIARLFTYILDWIKVGDDTKKSYYRFLAAFEADLGISIKLHKSGGDQLERIREELKPKPEAK